jgi:hypothetical protein
VSEDKSEVVEDGETSRDREERIDDGKCSLVDIERLVQV